MAPEPTHGREIISAWHRNFLLTMGGVVCVTQSGKTCPDWPGCFGRIIPPPQVNSIIEYTHRLIVALTSPFIFAATVVGWRKARSVRRVSRPPAVAILLLLAVIVFGALAVLRGLSPGLAAQPGLGAGRAGPLAHGGGGGLRSPGQPRPG
jgi:heme A synthase